MTRPDVSDISHAGRERRQQERVRTVQRGQIQRLELDPENAYEARDAGDARADAHHDRTHKGTPRFAL